MHGSCLIKTIVFKQISNWDKDKSTAVFDILIIFPFSSVSEHLVYKSKDGLTQVEVTIC